MNFDFKDAATGALRQMLANARQAIPTEDTHANPTHRADEWMRDTLEELIHEVKRDGCGRCWKCLEANKQSTNFMIICATCGNKRCPHATDCKLDCTGSNDPMQEGSAYGGVPDMPPPSLRRTSPLAFVSTEEDERLLRKHDPDQ